MKVADVIGQFRSRSQRTRSARNAICCIVSLSAVLNSGCSFLFMPRPPPESRFGVDVRTCTTNQAAPVVDTLMVGLQFVRIGIAAGASEQDYRQAPLPREADIAIGASLLALFATSALVGYTHVKACKEARGEGPDAGASRWRAPAGARRTLFPGAPPAPAVPTPGAATTATAQPPGPPTLTSSPAGPYGGPPAAAVQQQTDDEEADRPRRSTYEPAGIFGGHPGKPAPRTPDSAGQTKR
jgi:hypothetical protein